MKDIWTSRIRRAEQLANENAAVADVLRFYAVLLRAQAGIHERLRDGGVTGVFDHDLAVIGAAAPGLLHDVAHHGADPLADAARRLSAAGEAALDEMLIEYWRKPADTQFFAKAILQPYASLVVESAPSPLRAQASRAATRCPRCGGKPQLAVLVNEDADASGGRSLLCSLCLSTWPFGRVVCANCGERDEPKLGYFRSPDWNHVRVEACDTCRCYLKGIDLSRLGLAVPLVDELAAAPLDLWARDRGYTKIEMNLIGL